MTELFKPSRRGFIGGLLAAVAAPAIIRTPGLLMRLAPQPLLLPEPRLLSLDEVTRTAMLQWKYSNGFLQSIESQYNAIFGKEGTLIGRPLRIHLPKDLT